MYPACPVHAEAMCKPCSEGLDWLGGVHSQVAGCRVASCRLQVVFQFSSKDSTCAAEPDDLLVFKGVAVSCAAEPE